MSRPSPSQFLGIMASAVLMLSGCTGNASESKSAPTTASQPSVKPNVGGSAGAATAERVAPDGSFAEWRDRFRVKALASGISARTFDRAFQGVRLNRKVVELDNRQPEFSRAIWQYLDSAVSNTRVSTGRAKARAMSSALRSIQSKYRVDFPAVLAIWGLESGFGANFGSIKVIESLATLAYDGRRKEFGEEQLLAALRILEAGDITPGRMVGSWAGAMGHTQFIPTSFLRFAVDHTGDGRRDIWAPDAVDALASTANYLAHFGWVFGAPAAVEVRLPGGFDYALASQSIRKSVSEWRAIGIQAVSGGLIESEGVSIIVPGGARGPAFAVYPNFRVIKRYNNATSYALAVARLAARISGDGPIKGSWPRDDRALSRTEKQELQRRLTAMGYDTQGVDGIIGPNSRDAVRAFQKARGMVPDGYVSGRVLQAVRAAGG